MGRRSSNDFCSRSITNLVRLNDYEAAAATAAEKLTSSWCGIFHVCLVCSRELASVVSASAALISFQCIAPSYTAPLADKSAHTTAR